MMRLIKPKDIESADFAQESKERAKRLNDIEIEYRTDKHLGFIVKDDVKDTVHHVIYMDNKSPPADWSCDCNWHATRGTFGKYCAHILAVNLWLAKEKERIGEE